MKLHVNLGPGEHSAQRISAKGRSKAGHKIQIQLFRLKAQREHGLAIALMGVGDGTGSLRPVNIET